MKVYGDIDVQSGGLNLGDEDLTIYDEGTFTPTVTLVGGSGNTVPTYVQNIGRYTRIGRMVFVDINLDGDGGAEGAGTGEIHIALPIQAATISSLGDHSISGKYANGSIFSMLFISIASAATTCKFLYQTSLTAVTSLKGSDQDNISRNIRLRFHYEV